MLDICGLVSSEQVGCRRTDDLLLSTYATDEGTSNIVLEDDNKGAEKEGDASGEKGVRKKNGELEP